MMIASDMLSGLTGIRHGFATRLGGVSGGIYATLNCGLGSDDTHDNVAENRARLARLLGVAPEGLVSPCQIHSATVVTAHKPWAPGDAPKADGVVTTQPGLAIAISAADCVPVLFADARGQVVGAAHAGWRGALSGILEATLGAMETLGADRARIRAAIGPAISQDAYEVGDDFEARFLDSDKANARFFARKSRDARPHFDLTGYVAMRLERAGAGQVENLQLCTYGDKQRFFSYRRSCHDNEAGYGRQISAILIE